MQDRMYLYDGEHVPLTVANGKQGEAWIMRVLLAGGTVIITRPGRQPFGAKAWRQTANNSNSSRSGQTQPEKAVTA